MLNPSTPVVLIRLLTSPIRRFYLVKKYPKLNTACFITLDTQNPGIPLYDSMLSTSTLTTVFYMFITIRTWLKKSKVCCLAKQ
jgi:hypothetical protein